ncbi:MAG: hypothetical protein PHX68_01105 [Alphaproteobacteria bacterium]|nr:hypothetical protein [Alphaproteobacteria bacterium]
MAQYMTAQEVEMALKRGDKGLTSTALKRSIFTDTDGKYGAKGLTHMQAYDGGKLIADFEMVNLGGRLGIHGNYTIFKEDGKNPLVRGYYEHGKEDKGECRSYDSTGHLYYMERGAHCAVYDAANDQLIEMVANEVLGRRLKELAEKKSKEEPAPKPEPAPAPEKPNEEPTPAPKEEPIKLNQGNATGKGGSDDGESAEKMPPEYDPITAFWKLNWPERADGNKVCEYTAKTDTLKFDFYKKSGDVEKLDARIEYKTPQNVTLSGVNNAIPDQEYFDKMCAEIANRGETQIELGKIWDTTFKERLEQAAEQAGLTIANDENFTFAKRPRTFGPHNQNNNGR